MCLSSSFMRHLDKDERGAPLCLGQPVQQASSIKAATFTGANSTRSPQDANWSSGSLLFCHFWRSLA